MKRGRELYKAMEPLPERIALLRDLSGEDLLELMHYAEGMPGSETRDEILGTALVVAGERYFAKVHKKLVRRAKRIL